MFVLTCPSQTLPIIKPHICTANRRSRSSPSLVRLPPSTLKCTPIRCVAINTCHYTPASPYPYMKHGYGAFGGATLTLEPSRLDMSQEVNQPKLEPLLDTGGNDDDGGRGNRIGGGGGNGGGDDDDEYNWRNIDPDDESFEPWRIFRKRGLVPEIFDNEAVNAVLSEWMKTMKDLPLGLRQAYSMGLLSSAQFTKFLWFNARPGVSRFLCSTLPQSLSRDFNGKMIADPSLPYKLLFEFVSAIGISVCWDSKQRGIERMKKEWRMVVTNAVTLASCNAFVVWSLAPCYRYGEGFGFHWLNNARKLPNNVFEKSYRFKQFDMQNRAASFFYKAVNLFTLGCAARSAQVGVSLLAATDRKEMRWVVTNLGGTVLGAGLSLGLYSNLRYQLLCGIDGGLVGYFDVIGVAIFFDLAMRILNAKVGAESLNWDVQSLKWNHDFNPIEDAAAAKWFDLKTAIASGFGLVDVITKRQGASSKGKRKRTTRKKLVISS